MDERLERIGRLAAVAQGLEREGAYNGAKLLRAAMERELVRHAATEAASGAAAVGAALDELISSMGDELPLGIMELLPTIADHVRHGRTIPLDDAPRVAVCRSCGEVCLGADVEADCPVCAGPPLSFRELAPIWYLDPAPPATLLAGLAASAAQVQRIVATRSDDALAFAPAPGEWSARQTLEHLLFAEGLFAERIGRLLAEDEPDLASRAVWAETPVTGDGVETAPSPASQLADEFATRRAATVTLLSALPEADWQRGGMHPEWGPVTVASQTAYFARHCASHIPQLTAAARGQLTAR